MQDLNAVKNFPAQRTGYALLCNPLSIVKPNLFIFYCRENNISSRNKIFFFFANTQARKTIPGKSLLLPAGKSEENEKTAGISGCLNVSAVVKHSLENAPHRAGYFLAKFSKKTEKPRFSGCLKNFSFLAKTSGCLNVSAVVKHSLENAPHRAGYFLAKFSKKTEKPRFSGCLKNFSFLAKTSGCLKYFSKDFKRALNRV